MIKYVDFSWWGLFSIRVRFAFTLLFFVDIFKLKYFTRHIVSAARHTRHINICILLTNETKRNLEMSICMI